MHTVSTHYVVSGLSHHFENVSGLIEIYIKEVVNCVRCCGNERKYSK